MIQVSSLSGFKLSPGMFKCRGASVCSGDLHPDTILQQDQRLKIEKKAFYEDLHKYHNEYVKDFLVIIFNAAYTLTFTLNSLVTMF